MNYEKLLNQNPKWHEARADDPKYNAIAVAIKGALRHVRGTREPQSVVDIGSSLGYLLQRLDWIPERHGIDNYTQIEESWQAPNATPHRIDLSNKREIRRCKVRADLLVCLATAEHLACPSNGLFHMPLLGMFEIVANPGSVLIFSGATRRENGGGHINARDPEEYMAALQARRWRYNHEASMVLAYEFGRFNGRRRRAAYYYRNNTMVFDRF